MEGAYLDIHLHVKKLTKMTRARNIFSMTCSDNGVHESEVKTPPANWCTVKDLTPRNPPKRKRFPWSFQMILSSCNLNRVQWEGRIRGPKRDHQGTETGQQKKTTPNSYFLCRLQSRILSIMAPIWVCFWRPFLSFFVKGGYSDFCNPSNVKS